MDVQLGDVAAWVSGVSTTAAVIIAMVSIHEQRRQLLVALQEQAIAENRHLSEVARRVAAWPETWDDRVCRGVCRNLSDEPVYSVHVELTTSRPASASGGSESLDSRYLAVLAPGEEQRFELSAAQGLNQDPEIALSFSDCNGIRWQRMPDGRLTFANVGSERASSES